LKAVIVDRLVKRFGRGILRRGVTVLNGVSFEVDEGSHVAVVGPPSSGKLVLLKILSAMYRPTSGKVLVYGHDVVREPRRVQEVTSLVCRSFRFHERLNLKETLRFVASVQGRRFEEAVALLRELGFRESLSKPIAVLPEDVKDLVRLAIGLLKRPKLLLLHKALEMLDMETKERVVDYLEDVGGELTYIMVENDPNVAARLCDYVLVLGPEGRMLKFCPIEEVVGSFPYRFTVKVYFKPRRSPPSWASSYPHRMMGEALIIHLSSEDEVAELSSLMTRSPDILYFEVSRAGMEDIYLWVLDEEPTRSEAFEAMCACLQSSAVEEGEPQAPRP